MSRRKSRKRKISKRMAIAIVTGLFIVIGASIGAYGSIQSAQITTYAHPKISSTPSANGEPSISSSALEPSATTRAPTLPAHTEQPSPSTTQSRPSTGSPATSAETDPGQPNITVRIEISSPPCVINSIIQVCLPRGLIVQAVVSENGGSLGNDCQVNWIIYKGASNIFEDPSHCNAGFSTGLVLQI